MNITVIIALTATLLLGCNQKKNMSTLNLTDEWDRNKGICTEALGRMIEHIRCRTGIKSLISGHFVDNPASGQVMEKCGFVPTGETVIDENQYQGADRPIRVLRLTISK